MALTLHYPFLTNPSLTGHSNLGLAASTPDLSITRATSAWDTDADGYIRKYQSGEARFTGATFTQNLTTSSNDFSTDWSDSNCTDAQNQGTDPFGGSAAQELTDNAVNNEHSQFVVTTYLSGHTYILSAYMKAGTSNFGVLGTNNSASNHRVIFNLGDGTVGNESANYTGTISDAGSGWYRCSILFSGENASIYQIVGVAQDATTNTYAGSSDTILVYGVQLEDVSGSGRTTPSTYIPTTTAAVSSLSGQSTKGLLVEEARTNICLQSEDAATTWILSANALLDTNATTAPDGSTTADRLKDDSSTGAKGINNRQSFALTAQTYTASTFVKADGHDWFMLRIDDVDITTTEQNIGQWFDLTNGVVGAAAEADTIDSGIEDYGNGWYRCWVTFAPTVVSSGVDFDRLVVEGDGVETATADGTSSIFLWGGQLEAGAFPTSYIATTTGTVTRNADTVTSTDVAWYNKSVGTMFANATTFGYGDVINQLFAITKGSNEDSRYLANGSSDNRSSAFKRIGFATAVNQFRPSVYDISTQARVRTAHGYDDSDGDHFLYANGQRSTLDKNDTQTLDDATAVWVGCNNSSDHWNGHIAEVAFWDERLDNDTLDGLSAGTTTIQAAGGGVLERKRRQHYRRQKLRAQGISYKETWAGTYRGRRG